MIETQLNKMESSNKFSKAVFHGSNQEFQLPTQEEQLMAVSCKMINRKLYNMLELLISIKVFMQH